MSSDASSAVFLRGVLGQVNRDDLGAMVEAQRSMLMRFEKSNEMLLNFNALSSARYQTTAEEFKRHTQLLADMKRDLDLVFRRIRSLKTKLSKAHPEAFKVCSDVYNVLEESEAEETADTEDKAPPRGQMTPVDAVLKVVCESGVNPAGRQSPSPREPADVNRQTESKTTEDNSQNGNSENSENVSQKENTSIDNLENNDTSSVPVTGQTTGH